MARLLRSVLISAAPIWAAVAVGASLRTGGAVEAGTHPELQASPVSASETDTEMQAFPFVASATDLEVQASPFSTSATDSETEASPTSTSATSGRDCVVLLHGLGRTPRSMRRLASDL